MIEVAYEDYGYSQDHRLNDTLSGITNMSLCIGEILGPITSSLLYSLVGYSMAATIIACTVCGYSLIYLVFSDACVRLGKKSLLVPKTSSEYLEMQ